jgi:hypothetical protein
MAFTTAPLEGANSVLKAFGAPYDLRHAYRDPGMGNHNLQLCGCGGGHAPPS